MSRKVVIVQRIVPHYRLAFFEELLAQCRGRDLEILLLHGQERPGQTPRGLGRSLPAAIPAEFAANRYLGPPGCEVVWQPVLGRSQEADLVVVEQANRLLSSQVLLWRRRWLSSRPKLALWGHGRNLQGRPGSPAETYKRLWRGWADFWLAYTKPVYDSLDDIPAQRKTWVNNAMDTRQLARQVEAARHRGLVKDPSKVVFCAGMHEHKRLEFLFQALDSARQGLPGLSAEFIGDGPQAHLVRRFCAERGWARWHGALYGQDKADLLWQASLMVMPGLVGLVILDCFVARTPLLTTPFGGRHSPEIAYLEPGRNGWLAGESPAEYARALRGLLSAPGLLRELRDGCRESAGRYSVQNMARRFADGLEQALALPPGHMGRARRGGGARRPRASLG